MSEYSEHKPLKTKKLIKRALKHPELFTEGEVQYFELVKKERKERKKAKKQIKSDCPE
tara:strand:+ start:646 stop:819 length:174 start_codon:yes stop_codon:yes gene_type:complete